MTDYSEKTQKAALEDATVAFMVKQGKTEGEIISVLVYEKEQRDERIAALLQIAPFKMVAPDGRVLTWHCPDEFIPIKESFLKEWNQQRTTS